MAKQAKAADADHVHVTVTGNVQHDGVLYEIGDTWVDREIAKVLCALGVAHEVQVDSTAPAADAPKAAE